MRDIVSCFSENAVNVSNYTSCSSSSSYASIHNPCIINQTTLSSSSSSPNSPSIQNSVSSLYKLVLSTLKHFFFTVTWCRSHSNQGLTITFGNNNEVHDPSSAPATFRLNTNSRFFRKKKGSKLIELCDGSSSSSKIEVFWDLSNARYESGPEPVEGFYLVILVDTEVGLVLGGDAAEEFTSKKLKSNSMVTKTSLLSRREHCSGTTQYTTKAQFCETGTFHDVLIRCTVENEDGVHSKNNNHQHNPVLSVCIDKKTVIRVKRLQWNFRGNQTIFVDGLLVDLLWDVHDWFFNSNANGGAVFMFRTRSGLDSRLWLQEKTAHKDKDRIEFSLLIYASKTS
ncbi:hypothetical protein PIB30_005686 [Stylosanthes scabra]|uniref:Uncharacterized protein n=1 Tax=Stylosanthes scabra TaxID=79078 RepID=A0ABU6U2V2_9FABA|nr:hypothetical protein [Stylosanthes scabra]